MGLSWLQPNDPFPSPWSDADPDPEVPGLLAVSEDISAEQLLRAYHQGIFPWYSDGHPFCGGHQILEWFLDLKTSKSVKISKKKLKLF